MDYVCDADLGLAQFNLATVALNSIRHNTKTQGPHGPTRLEGNPSQLDDLLDTWVVLYLDSIYSSSLLEDSVDRWVQLSSALQYVANVAIVDLAGQYQIRDADVAIVKQDLAKVRADRSLIVSSLLTRDTEHFVDTDHTYDTLPIVKVHMGRRRNGDPFVPDTAGQTWWMDPLGVDAIEAEVGEMMRGEGLLQGSIASVPVKLQLEYQEALRNMKYYHHINSAIRS